MDEGIVEDKVGNLRLLPVAPEAVADLATPASTDDGIVEVTEEDIAALEEERLFRQESEIDAANRLFKEHLVPVAASLVKTAIFGTNARVRLEAQKMILDRTLGRVQDTQPETERDPFKELLASCVRSVTKDGK